LSRAIGLLLEKKEKQIADTELQVVPSGSAMEKIPTTFVNLAPEKMALDLIGMDVLGGVFHIMWSDMPTRRTYGIRLADHYTSEGNPVGTSLICTFPKETKITL
jgi:hypothetical protein